MWGRRPTGGGTSTETTEAAEKLPVSVVMVEEAGPTSLDEAVAMSESVLVAVLDGVEPRARVYGGSPEDPDPIWFEEVGLRFTPEQVLHGEIPAEPLTVPWTSYTLTDDGHGAERTGIVRIGDRTVTEDDVGRRYLLLLTRSESGKLHVIGLSSGIAGVVDGRVADVSASGALRDLEGRPVEEVTGG